MSKATVKQAEQAEAIKQLRKYLKPGDTVYCVLRHVSSSGMTRRIDFFKPGKKDQGMIFLSGYIATACGYRRSRNHDGLIVGGCGMDMGFSVVYDLARTIFPKGFKVKGRGRNGDTSGWDNDGGYALSSRWL